MAGAMSVAMTDVVARRARALGLGEVVARAADASELPFDDGTFEAVTCSTVLMLCPDPVRAASEMRRVLRRGGRLAVAVWDERSRSPFFDLALDTLSAVLPVPQDSDRPGPFRLARPGALEEVLQAAGFSTATTETCPFAFECSSPEEYVEAFISLATGLKDRLATLPAQEADRLRSALAARARAYAVSGRLRLGAVALCAAAPKE